MKMVEMRAGGRLEGRETEMIKCCAVFLFLNDSRLS